MSTHFLSSTIHSTRNKIPDFSISSLHFASIRLSSSILRTFSQSTRWMVMIPCPIAHTIRRFSGVGSQHLASLYGISRAFPMMTWIHSGAPFDFTFVSFFFSFFSSVLRSPSSVWMISSWITLRILVGLRERFPSCTSISSRSFISRL